MKRRFFFYLAFACMGWGPFLQADTAPRGMGLKPLTEKEIKYIQSHRVTAVLPNKLGAARMRIEAEKLGHSGSIDIQVQPVGEREFLRKKGAANPYAGALPRAVDNSKLPAFPPVGDQGGHGACVAFATTYYQATHEAGLLRGYNNKPSNYHIRSPKWTYNMINYGNDYGAYFLDGYTLLSQNGTINFPTFPYDDNYREWDLNPKDWVGAMEYRMTPMVALPVNSTDLSQVKQALANGHVLGFGTTILSWVFTTIQSNPATQNRHIGEDACTWVNGTKGGHLMTIVGYDDDIWIDVNGNGKVDPGEMGAFLVCNSWGANWRNKGFVWISYDAFLDHSAVPNGPSINRSPAATVTNSCFLSTVAKGAPYKPTLVAEFNLGHVKRNQIYVSTGASDTSQTSPTKTFLSGALRNQGGPYLFNGTNSSTPMNGIFSVDLSDLIIPGGGMQRFYLTVQDTTAGDPMIINGLTLVDLKRGIRLPISQVPATLDKQKFTAYIDYAVPQGIAAAAFEEPVQVELTSPIGGEKIEGVVPVVASITGPVSSVYYYINSTLLGADLSEPYLFLLDTTRFPDGTYELSVVVEDGVHPSTIKKVSVTIANENEKETAPSPL